MVAVRFTVAKPLSSKRASYCPGRQTAHHVVAAAAADGHALALERGEVTVTVTPGSASALASVTVP